jgi:hypothetical protein
MLRWDVMPRFAKPFGKRIEMQQRAQMIRAVSPRSGPSLDLKA